MSLASAYQIKYSTTMNYLMDSNFNSQLSAQFELQDVIDGSMQPLESGDKQHVTLRLPSTAENVTYYVALRATNADSISSDTSNIISCQIVHIKEPSTQPPTTTTTTSTTTSTPETSTISTTTSTQETSTSTTTSSLETSTTISVNTGISYNQGCVALTTFVVAALVLSLH